MMLMLDVLAPEQIGIGAVCVALITFSWRVYSRSMSMMDRRDSETADVVRQCVEMISEARGNSRSEHQAMMAHMAEQHRAVLHAVDVSCRYGAAQHQAATEAWNATGLGGGG